MISLVIIFINDYHLHSDNQNRLEEMLSSKVVFRGISKWTCANWEFENSIRFSFPEPPILEPIIKSWARLAVCWAWATLQLCMTPDSPVFKTMWAVSISLTEVQISVNFSLRILWSEMHCWTNIYFTVWAPHSKLLHRDASLKHVRTKRPKGILELHHKQQ